MRTRNQSYASPKKVKPKNKIKESLVKSKKKLVDCKKNVVNDYCKEWLLDQTRNPIDVDLTVDPDDVIEVEEEDISGIDYVKTLNDISMKNRKKNLKRKVNFECEWKGCELEFDSETPYLEHIKIHTKTAINTETKLYQCEWNLCTFATESNEQYSRHIHFHGYHTKIKIHGDTLRRNVTIPPCSHDSRNRNIVEDIRTNYFCHWKKCTNNFVSINDYLFHVKEHINYYKWDHKFLAGNILCGWDNCNKKCVSMYRLYEHVRTHTKEKKIACPHCGAMFCSNTKYFDHCKRQIMNNTQEYQCSQCMKFFASERILKDHMRCHINCHKCSMCDMSCPSYSTLIQHIRYRHIDIKPLKCHHCDSRFVHKRDLEIHTKIHQEHTIECEEYGCTFTCKSLYLLKHHEIRMHARNPNIYVCHCCSNRYISGKNLSTHLITKHGFQHPSGHSRFSYKEDDDGFFRLQTTRIEILEVTKQIMSTNDGASLTVDSSIASDYDSHDYEDDNVEEVDQYNDDDDDNKSIDNDVVELNQTIESEEEEGSESTPIGIDHFKVMKKYLHTHQPSKNIIVDVKDVDEDGNVIKNELIEIGEIEVN